MPRKRTLTEERVIDAAFQLLRSQGFAAVTARAVAQELGSSTMPIYSTFRSMDRLVKQLRKRALEVLVEYQAEPFTPDVLFNLALGYVRFAREEAHLFRFYFVEHGEALSNAEQQRMRERVFEKLGLERPPESPLSALPKAVQDTIAFKSWIFVHGVAVLVNGGILEDTRDETLSALIAEAGHAFGEWELAHGARSGRDRPSPAGPRSPSRRTPRRRARP